MLAFPAMFVATVVVATALISSHHFRRRTSAEREHLAGGRAALGVATGVAPWAGKDPEDRVVSLRASGLSTFAFGIHEIDGPANAAARRPVRSCGGCSAASMKR